MFFTTTVLFLFVLNSFGSLVLSKPSLHQTKGSIQRRQGNIYLDPVAGATFAEEEDALDRAEVVQDSAEGSTAGKCGAYQMRVLKFELYFLLHRLNVNAIKMIFTARFLGNIAEDLPSSNC